MIKTYNDCDGATVKTISYTQVLCNTVTEVKVQL